MSERKLPLLVICEQSGARKRYASALKGVVPVLFAASSADALSITGARAREGAPLLGVVLHLPRSGHAKRNGIELIRRLSAAEPELRWTIVAELDSRGVRALADVFESAGVADWDLFAPPIASAELLARVLRISKPRMGAQERFAAISQICRSVGHQFGNILMKISGRADLALAEQDCMKARPHLEQLLQTVERAGLLVRNLQAFSRNGLVMRETSLASCVNEAVVLMAQELTQNQIELRKVFEIEPTGRFDARALTQVFLNLLTNAVQAMAEGGTLAITIAAGRAPSEALVRIEDSGEGIARDVLPRIFEFGFSTRGERGNGLGLSVAKAIVEGHRGRIDVRSAPGKGTTFDLFLPL